MRCRGLGRAPALFGGRSQEKPCYFRGGAMLSFAALATRNFTTVFALILIASPVCGLRPMRALRSALTNRPSPGITNTPFFLVSFTAVSASRSRNAADCLLVNSSFSANVRTSAVLVKPVAILCPSFLGLFHGPIGSAIPHPQASMSCWFRRRKLATKCAFDHQESQCLCG